MCLIVKLLQSVSVSCVYFVRKIIIWNHYLKITILNQHIFGGSCGVAALVPCSMLACVSQRKLNHCRAPPPPKSFGASTTLWWTKAALASSRAVLTNSSACMPTPGLHTGWEAWITPDENYISQSAADHSSCMLLINWAWWGFWLGIRILTLIKHDTNVKNTTHRQ